MSDLNRDAIVAEADEQAEATGSSRWGTNFKLRRLDVIFKQEWHKILSANPMYRWALRTPTAGAGATILYTALDSPNPPTGDTQERFHRVLGVARDETQYIESEFRDHPLLVVSGIGPIHKFWQEGDHIALPASDANAPMRVWVNHTPSPPSELSAGTIVPTFPRDYSLILAYELAASMLSKGGTETDRALELKAFAKEQRTEMLDELTRRSTKAMFFEPTDTSAAWGAR